MNFNRFSIHELKRFRGTLGYDTISCLLVDEIDELIEYKKIPNVFKIYTNSEPFIKVDESLSYVGSYCVKNLLGLKRLSKYLNVHVEGEKNNYLILIDVFKDCNGILIAKSLNKAWNIFGTDRRRFLKDMFEERYERDINIELPTGDLISSTVNLDIVNVFKIPTKYEYGLICKRTINDFDYFYTIVGNKIRCSNKFNSNVNGLRHKYAGKIILSNLEKEYDSEEFVIKKFKLKNINYNVYYGDQLKKLLKNIKKFKMDYKKVKEL